MGRSKTISPVDSDRFSLTVVIICKESLSMENVKGKEDISNLTAATMKEI